MRSKQKLSSTTRSEMISLVAEKSRMTEPEVEKVLNNFFNITVNELSKNKSVKITGFGVFSMQKTGKRDQFSPFGGQYHSDGSYVPKFRASKGMAEKVLKKFDFPDSEEICAKG